MRRASNTLSHVSSSLSPAAAAAAAEGRTSPLSIRQVALVARELDAPVRALHSWLECPPGNGFRDAHIAQLGLCNTVLCLEGTFLEVVSPLTEDNTAAAQLRRRGGDGGYMVMLQTTDLKRDLARAKECGFQVVLRVDHEELNEVHLHPKHTNKCIFSLTESRPARAWRWGGPDWERTSSRFGAVCGAVLQVDNLDEACIKRFSGLLDGTPTVITPGEDVVFPLAEGGRLRIIKARDGRGDGLHGLEIRTTKRERAGTRLQACGVTIFFV